MMKNSKHTEERKMADIRDSKNWGFETKQLHIGQEKADPVTDARAVPIYASTIAKDKDIYRRELRYSDRKSTRLNSSH